MKHNLVARRRHQDTLSLIRNGKNVAVSDSQLLDMSFPDFCRSLKIKTDTGLKPFELFDWQERFIDVLLENPKTPITLLSSRQTGKTAMVLALLVWLSLSRYQFSGLVIHRKGEDSRQLARRTKRFIPDGIRLTSDSLSLIEFRDTQSELHFRSSNPKTGEVGAESCGRGLSSISAVVLEEASHSQNVKDILRVVGPTLTWSDMGNIIMIGTAGPKRSYFYDSLVNAYGSSQQLERTLEDVRQKTIEPFQVSKSKNRIGIITNWRSIPQFANEPDCLERIAREQDLTEGMVQSEHELHFDSDTSTAVFDFKQVLAAQQGNFEDAIEDGVYFCGLDGSGAPRPGRKDGDFTCAVILRKDDEGKLSVVKLYRKRNISFERRYAELSELLNSYRPVYTLVEANDGLGQSYHEQILSACPSLDIERFVNSDTRKANAIGKIQLALERQDLSIPKSPITDELLSFQVLDNGRMEGIGRGVHDDTVMALAMAVQASNYGIRGIFQ